ncbi:MAG: hypothetical protein KC493_11890 [Bacteriovoracaceae bacterium]|nr:hypothetical protein [Bacteriovoracaceae bacterium]
MKTILAFTFCLTLLSSCASIEDKYCHSDGAKNTGKFDATKWQPFTPEKFGHHCKEVKDFNEQSFSTTYQQGYEEVMKTQCTPENIKILAKSAVTKNDTSHRLAGNLNLCSKVGGNEKKLKKVYLSTFDKSFCIKEKFNSLGVQDSNALNEQNHTFLNACSKRVRTKLKRSYQQAYRKQMKFACAPVNLNQLAVKDAKNKLPMAEGLILVKRCPSKLQSNAIASYSLAYNQEQKNIQNLEYTKKLEEQLKEQRVQNSRQDFALGGKKITSFCKVKGTEATSTLKLADSSSSYSGRAKFRWEYYREDGSMADNSIQDDFINLSYYGAEDEITNWMATSDTVSCKLLLIKQL